MTISRNLSILADGASSAGVLDVASGGTGVTTSLGANSVMLRDANQNVSINRLNQQTTSVTASGGTTTLTAASTFSWVLNGTGGQTFRLPDATTLTDTTTFEFNNNATGTLTIVDNASGAVGTIVSGGAAAIALLSNTTVAGTWDVHAYIPENVQWGTNSLALGSTVITGGTWQGGTIQSGYGGTGLTTFTGANNALYSTSASALAAGTLPVLAGGTGVTTSTGSGSNVLSTSPTLVSPALGTPTALVGTNITGTAAGLSIGGNAATATTAANGGVTSATAVAGTGISVTAVTTTGAATHTITNSGVTSVSAGTGISVSASTGGVTITNTSAGGGVTSIVAGNGISINTGTGAVTITNSIYTPAFNSVGSYCFIYYYQFGGTVTSGSNYSAGSGTGQMRNLAFNIDNCGNFNPNGTTQNNLSGTWKYMGAGSSNNNVAMAIGVRVA